MQESSGCANKARALQAEAKRRSELLDRRAGFTKVKLAPKLEEFILKEFLVWSKQRHRRKTYELHELNCETLKRFFRGKYLDEITSKMVEDFKSARKNELGFSGRKGTFCRGRDRESEPSRRSSFYFTRQSATAMRSRIPPWESRCFGSRSIPCE